MRKLNAAFATLCALAGMTIAASAGTLTPSGPVVINGQNGTTISGLHISSTSGACVEIINSSNITLEGNEIGPCGTNNTTSPSQGVVVQGGTGNSIYDNYIHVDNLASGCCDSHDNIFVNGTSNLTVQGNVLAYGESNIELTGALTTTVNITGNFFLNPRGPSPRGQQVQVWGSASSPYTGISVTNNYALSSDDTTIYLYPEHQEDALNFGYTNGPLASNNYVVGGKSPSGCGIIADYDANSVQFSHNILSNTGQCGIGIASGTNQLVTGNKVLNLTPVSGGGNTAIYVWNQTSYPCGPVTVSNNIADEINTSGANSSFWNGGGCGTVTLTGNTFDQAAYNLIYPMSTTNPPPPIPPQPKSCATVSPYTTNTAFPACGTSGGSGGTAAPPAVTSISPTSGSTSGGTEVTISGSGFTGASAINFGATTAAFTVINDATITATSPAEAAGTVDVTVSTGAGKSATTAADRFTYVAPPSPPPPPQALPPPCKVRAKSGKCF